MYVIHIFLLNLSIFSNFVAKLLDNYYFIYKIILKMLKTIQCNIISTINNNIGINLI